MLRLANHEGHDHRAVAIATAGMDIVGHVMIRRSSIGRQRFVEHQAMREHESVRVDHDGNWGVMVVAVGLGAW